MLGTDFGCALIDDGTVRCWGGDTVIVPGPSRTLSAAPMTAQPVARLTDVTRIASSLWAPVDCGGQRAYVRWTATMVGSAWSMLRCRELRMPDAPGELEAS